MKYAKLWWRYRATMIFALLMGMWIGKLAFVAYLHFFLGR